MAARLRPRPELSITTNAIGLARMAGTLRDAGLDRVNVSLDTLRPEAFRELTRRDRLDDVLDGLAAGLEPGIVPPRLGELACLLQVPRYPTAARTPPGLLLDGQVPDIPRVRAMATQIRLLCWRKGQAVTAHAKTLSITTDTP